MVRRCFHVPHLAYHNLARKPELGYTKSKKNSEFALCKFGIAANKLKSEKILSLSKLLFSAYRLKPEMNISIRALLGEGAPSCTLHNRNIRRKQGL